MEIMQQLRNWKDLLATGAINGVRMDAVSVRRLIGTLVAAEAEIGQQLAARAYAPVIDVTEYREVRR